MYSVWPAGGVKAAVLSLLNVVPVYATVVASSVDVPFRLNFQVPVLEAAPL